MYNYYILIFYSETTNGNCDPLKVLTGVAHNEPVGIHAHCKDHQHAQAWSFVAGACTLPHHHWYKGAKVNTYRLRGVY
jgi:hypothetical protein